MRILRPLALVLIALVARPAFPQDAAKRLTNQDIIEMTNLNLSDDVIIAKIRSATGADASKFDTSVDGLKALKAANVSDAVIKVMINPTPPPPPVVTTAAPMTLDPNFPPPEVGVYWKDAAIARTKAGGRAASFATDGIRGQHWDAVLEGPASKNHVKDRRPIFYLYVPDGSSAADYALIKLQKKGDRREFQVGSFGGIGGGKSGVKKDKEVSCSSEHVGIRMYKITLNEDLKPGEYAFFMGTGSQSNMSSGRVSSSSGGAASGRVYDFNIPE
jgi:hypothetical protein